MQTAVDESRNTKDAQRWHDFEAVEKFISRVYNAANAEGCNEARAALFSGCRSSEALPQTSDAARWHIYGAHFQAMVWRQAHKRTPPYHFQKPWDGLNLMMKSWCLSE